MQHEEAQEAVGPRRVGAAIWLAVMALALARFIHLGQGDLMDWDEAIHAWRAKAICFCGTWRDQSGFAFGGLFAGAYPPLHIWVTAILFRLFGFSEFWARAWPSLSRATMRVLSSCDPGSKNTGRLTSGSACWVVWKSWPAAMRWQSIA